MSQYVCAADALRDAKQPVCGTSVDSRNRASGGDVPLSADECG